MGPISGERGESREDSRTEENGFAAGAGGATVGATRGEDVLPLVCAAAVLALGISRKSRGPNVKTRGACSGRKVSRWAGEDTSAPLFSRTLASS